MVSWAWAPASASCTQLVSTGAQMFPEAKGSADPGLTVQEIHSGGACVSKLSKTGQVARSAWLGYRFAVRLSFVPCGCSGFSYSTLEALWATSSAAKRSS